jgi:hypothetical protein
MYPEFMDEACASSCSLPTILLVERSARKGRKPRPDERRGERDDRLYALSREPTGRTATPWLRNAHRASSRFSNGKAAGALWPVSRAWHWTGAGSA